MADCYIIDPDGNLYEVGLYPGYEFTAVKHGKWERIPYSFAGGYRCSCCGQKSLERHWNYCPNCGARMDGE